MHVLLRSAQEEAKKDSLSSIYPRCATTIVSNHSGTFHDSRVLWKVHITLLYWSPHFICILIFIFSFAYPTSSTLAFFPSKIKIFEICFWLEKSDGESDIHRKTYGRKIQTKVTLLRLCLSPKKCHEWIKKRQIYSKIRVHKN